MRSEGFLFYLTCLFFAQASGLESSLSIKKTRPFISVKTGESQILETCGNKNTFSKLFWFKQVLGQKMQHISTLAKYKDIPDRHGEFEKSSHFKVDAKNNLNITNLRVSDSATYYCAVEVFNHIIFMEGTYISVEDSSSDLQSSVHQPETETISVGGSATLNCTVHTGICDGEHSVYWFKDGEGPNAGLIYTYEGRNNQCARNSNAHTQRCIYNLLMDNQTMSDGETYYCAVASCGHILFGNGTRIQYESIGPYLERGALVLTTLLSVFQAFLLCIIIKRNRLRGSESFHRFSPPVTAVAEIDHNEENINYAAFRAHQVNRWRKQRDIETECVYSIVKA